VQGEKGEGFTVRGSWWVQGGGFMVGSGWGFRVRGGGVRIEWVWGERCKGEGSRVRGQGCRVRGGDGEMVVRWWGGGVEGRNGGDGGEVG
jgi:hypothetical protein